MKRGFVRAGVWSVSLSAFFVAVFACVCGVGPAGASESKSRVCVVNKILPVMEKPGMPYSDESGYLEGDGIRAVVVYGNHLTVSSVEGEYGAEWVRLEYEDFPSGYIEKKGLEPLPDYTPLEGVFFQAVKDDPRLMLRPEAKNDEVGGKTYDISRYDFFLLKGEVVPAYGELIKDDIHWILLGFGTADNGNGGSGMRFAWASADELQCLSDYEPDHSRILPERIPTRIRGMERLSEEEKEEIAARGFRIDPILPFVSFITADEMSDRYLRTGYDTPDFVTTDIFFHAYHIVFDRTLQHLEATYFLPALKGLLTAASGRLDAVCAASADSPLKDARELVRDVLTLSLALLDENPDSKALSSAAGAEYERIMAAEGREDSKITGSREDYTQYRPRGHYTILPELERYFRAMSFLGNAHLALAGGPSEAAQAESPEKNRLLTNASAVAIFCTLWEDSAIAPLWRKFQDPLIYMMGKPDDHGTDEMAGIVRGVISGDLSLLKDADTLDRLLSRLQNTVERPRITDKEAGPVQGAEEKKEKVTGFRLIGKRFVFDAYVFERLTDPAVPGRTLPDAADVMATLGSRAAGEVVAAYEANEEYAQNLAALKKELPDFFASAEAGTSYSAWLQVLSDSFADSGSKQFFYRNGAWQWKKLLTGISSWAEMKHDTVLYAKQSGAEMGEGGDWLVGDFAPPQPRGYVEPEPQAFDRMAKALGLLSGLFVTYGMDDGGYAGKIDTLRELVTKAGDIAAREVAGDILSPDDYQTIKDLARSCDEALLLPAGMYDTSEADQDQLKMALVSDVATDFFNGQALHAATGEPGMIYVYVDDRSGGARLVVGYVYSYYEFPRSLSDGRMTDEEWKKIVYDPEKAVELGKLHPAWYEKLLQGDAQLQ